MLYLSKIMDKLGYEEKDERFIRKFIKECEKSQVYIGKTFSGRNVLTEVKKLDMKMKGKAFKNQKVRENNKWKSHNFFHTSTWWWNFNYKKIT